MDEQYELISKDKLNKLREENKQLKARLENKPVEKESSQKKTEKTSSSPLINEKKFLLSIKELLENQQTKEQEFLLKEIADIKDINKSTLSNVISKTQTLDSKLETMVESLQGLTSNLSELITKVPHEFHGEDNDHKITDDINLTLISKLEEIDTFMKNLRVLLSYVKPSDMKMDKTSSNSIPQAPSVSSSPADLTPPPM